MDNKNFIKTIDTIYTDATFSSRYGLDILLTILLVATVVGITGYFSVLNNLQALRNNWETEKCNPVNFPFVHIINPDPNKTANQQISDNINQCLKDGISGYASDSLKDIFGQFDLFSDLKTYFDDFVNFIERVFIWLFNTIIYLINLLLSILQKSFLGFVHIFLKAEDSFKKMIGILVVNFFIFLQAFNMTIAFILNWASIATILIMVPLGITAAVLLALIIIVILLALLFTALSMIPFVGFAFITPSTIFWATLTILFIALIAVILILILMAIVCSALIHIQNTARRFITPTVTNVTPNPVNLIKKLNSFTPKQHVPLDEQIKQVTEMSQ